MPQACIFSNTIVIYLKKLVGNPGDGEESHPIAKNLLISHTRKIVLNKFTSSFIKNGIPYPSNSNFHLITLYRFHFCGCSPCCCIIFVSPSGFMYTCAMKNPAFPGVCFPLFCTPFFILNYKISTDLTPVGTSWLVS